MPPRAVDEPFEHVLEERPGGAGRARRPDLLVVEQHDHRHRASAGSATRPARRRRPSTTPGCRAGRWRAATRRRRAPRRPDVEEAQLPPRRRASMPARVGEPLGELAGRRRPAAPHRLEVLLRVEHQPAVVDVAVEVDRELRHPRDRLGDVDEVRRAVAGHDPAGDAEVAVEPRVEEHAAVDLDAELTPADRTGVGLRLDPQARASRCGRRRFGTRRRRRSSAGRTPGDQRAVADDVAGAGTPSHASARRDGVEAGRSSRSRADSTAWHGDGEASRKLTRSASECGPGIVNQSGTGRSAARCRAGAPSR